MTDIYTKEELELVRKYSCESLYYFGKEVLGYQDAEPDPHVDLCRFVESKIKRKMVIGARGIYKSSFGTVARAMQILLANPNARVLVVQNTRENAEKTVKEIKDHFENNEKVRQVFDHLMPEKRGGWSTKGLTLKRSRVFKEPSVMAAGCETDCTSLHFDYIIGDDVVSAKRDDMKEGGLIILRPEEVAKAIGWYSITMEGLQVNTGDTERDTEVLFIVNRWGVEDFAAHVKNNDKFSRNNPDGFHILEMPAIKPDGSLLWPKGLSHEKLATIHKRQGDFMYYTQYLCKPYNPSDRGFEEEHFTYWAGTYPPGYEDDNQLYKVFAVMDMADVKKAASCYTGMVVFFVDEDNHIWVAEAIEDKLDTNGKLDLIDAMITKYNLPKIYIEENLHKELLKYVVDEHKKATGLTYKLELIQHKNASKEARIMRLQPHHQAHALHVKPSHTRLIQEMRDFPFTSRRDVLDALAYSMPIVRKPPKRFEELQENPIMNSFMLKDIKAELRKHRPSVQYGSGLFSNQTSEYDPDKKFKDDYNNSVKNCMVFRKPAQRKNVV